MTIKETGAAIGKLIKAKMENPERRQVITPFIQGQPGIGKSALISQLKEQFEFDELLDIRMSQHDSTDIKGIPKANDVVSKWLPPEFMPIKDSKYEGKKVLLFFDEFNRAGHDELQSLFEVVYDYKIGGKPLIDTCFVVCAGNLGADDNTVVTEMDAALNDRFVFFKIDDVKIDEWLEWADKNEISTVTKLFLKSFPQHLIFQKELYTITPRSWAQFDQLISLDTDIEENIRLYGPGKIYELTNEFLAYMKSVRITGLDVLDRYSEIKEKLIKLDRPEIHNICSDLILLVKNNPVELTSERASNLQTFFDNDLHDDNKVFLIREMKEANVDFITKWMESINELESVLTTTSMSKWWVAAMGLNEIDDFILQKVNIDAEIAEAIEQEEKKKLEEAAKA